MTLIKNDIFLIAAVLLTAACFYLYNSVRQDGNYISIYANGELYGQYSLSENRVVEVAGAENHVNIVEIRNNSVSVVDADCPDKICVKQQSVSKAGNTIICIPNRVSVKVEGQGAGVDAVVW